MIDTNNIIKFTDQFKIFSPYISWQI